MRQLNTIIERAKAYAKQRDIDFMDWYLDSDTFRFHQSDVLRRIQEKKDKNEKVLFIDTAMFEERELKVFISYLTDLGYTCTLAQSALIIKWN